MAAYTAVPISMASSADGARGNFHPNNQTAAMAARPRAGASNCACENAASASRASGGRPSKGGICDTRIISATPFMKPASTGCGT